MTSLKPFWRYYGGKFRIAPKYPKPLFGTVVEPFAGAAGYSLRYFDRNVVLIEKYAVVAEIWAWLIAVRSHEVLRVPLVEHVDDLPGWVPTGARHLVGFWMNDGTVSPRKSLSAGGKKLLAMGRKTQGWCAASRDRVASQVESIKHWKVVYGDYVDFPNMLATWFVDPPYSSSAGRYYVHHAVDFDHLAQWSRSRWGQVVVCEKEGATWLPFRSFGNVRGFKKQQNMEAWWYQVRRKPQRCRRARLHTGLRGFGEG